MKSNSLFIKIVFAAASIFFLNDVIAQTQSGIYAGGHFRRERTHTVNDLKASGFTYVILFNIQVEPNGDLTTDGQQICSNGVYTFGSTNPNYISDVTALKTGNTSINRIESCIGGWGNTSYANIRSLVNSQGTGTGSILYKNFRALKNTIPAMDAINNDDEATYDVNTATAFHVMLADIGFKTTLAPYMNKPYWQSVATNVNNQRSGAVDRIYLQVYEGGAGNNPCDWNINNIQLQTGDLNYENPTTIVNKMTSAKNNCNSKGGFLWVYNDNNINLPDLAGKINNIFGGGAVSNRVVTVHKDCNYTGSVVGLPTGDYTLSQLISRGVLNDDISSIQVASGYKAILYENDNFSGATLTVTSNNSCLVGAGWNDRVSSMRVQTATGSFSQTVQAESYSSMLGVQTETTTDAGGGMNVGWIDTGDWMAYNSISIPTTGSYLVEYRVASPNATGRVSMDLNAGSIQLGSVAIPNTGGWQNWTTVPQTVTINAGTYNFGIYAQTGGWNINWWRITKSGSGRNEIIAESAAYEKSQTLHVIGYPNPFFSNTKIEVSLPEAGQTELTVLNGIGNKITDLHKGYLSAGRHAFDFNADNIPSGIYFYSMIHQGKRITGKLIKK
jgi:hypothetical protein